MTAEAFLSTHTLVQTLLGAALLALGGVMYGDHTTISTVPDDHKLVTVDHDAVVRMSQKIDDIQATVIDIQAQVHHSTARDQRRDRNFPPPE